MTARFGAIEKAERELESAKNSYLRQKGWVATCATPGSYWMFRKEIGGESYVVGVDLAIGIQRSIDFLGPREGPTVAPVSPSQR